MLKYILPFILPWFSSEQSQSDACQRITYRDAKYIVCEFDPAVDDIRLFYANPQDGTVLRNFAALRDVLQREGLQLSFAMNAGMYHKDMTPVGLYIEKGEEKAPLITGEGWGNFHLLPNGVFFLKDGKAAVLESLAYQKAGMTSDYATQSGPMLVIDGALHPRFLPESDSLKIRNGVGVTAEGKVFFAISEDRVRFYDFGLLFRDYLKTPNALYFDGTISSVDIPSLGRRDRFYPMGPMVAVVKKPMPDSSESVPTAKNQGSGD